MAAGKTLCLYLRLSADDEQEGESSSIINQRKLLNGYLRAHSDLVQWEVLELSDDGYSGTNFERPGVSRLLNMTQCGQISCILVKDFSRFCRNYVALGDYLERIFPEQGVRFISVNDRYDSKTADALRSGQEIAFAGFIYDWYSKDTSMKVTAVKRRQMEAGLYLGPCAPYGFCKSAAKKGGLEPLEETAAVVRRMYGWAAGGWSDRQIAVQLNEEKVLSPRRFWQSKGIGMGFKNDSTLWEKSEVRRILRDVRNIGDMPVSKSRRIAAGNKKFIHKPEEEWLVISGTHEPLVSRTMFGKAMEQRRARTYTCAGVCAVSRPHMLSGRLRCAVCGRQMQRSTHRGGYADYRCPRTVLAAQTDCPAGHIGESAVLCALVLVFALLPQNVIPDFPVTAGTQNKAAGCQAFGNTVKRKGAGKCLGKPANTAAKTEALRACYEEYRSGKISMEQFMEQKEISRHLGEECGSRIQSQDQAGEDNETPEETLCRNIMEKLDRVVWFGGQTIEIILNTGIPY